MMNIGYALLLFGIAVSISLGLAKIDTDMKYALDDIANSVHTISKCGTKP